MLGYRVKKNIFYRIFEKLEPKNKYYGLYWGFEALKKRVKRINEADG